MGKLLEDLYFGRIAPWEMRVIPDPNLQRAMDEMLQYEEQLTGQLGEVEQQIFKKLIDAQDEVDSIMSKENFIQGFRLGVRLMVECMNEHDDDIKDGGD